MKTDLHFVFTPSGAGCLLQALRKAARSDPVITTYDDLSFGPSIRLTRTCARSGLRMNWAPPTGSRSAPTPSEYRMMLAHQTSARSVG